jgi:hypothetical protein
MNPFDFVKSISYTKEDLLSGSNNDELAEQFYVPYLVNKSFSYYPDTIMYANEVNKHDISKKLQYYYLLNSIRPVKRFAKWVNAEEENLDEIKHYYGYSTEKARQALKVLTTTQIDLIKQKLKRGGTDDKNTEFSRSEIKGK